MSNMKSLKISEQLHKTLTELGGKGETFEAIIWRIIATAKLNQVEKKIVEQNKKSWEDSL